MASGTGKLWDGNCEGIRHFQKYVEDNWLKIATNSQLAERWVKDSDEFIATSRDKKMSNIYAIIMSRTVMISNDDTGREHKDRIRKVTKFFSRGRLGERNDKRTGAIDIVNDKNRDDVRGSMLAKTIIKRTTEMRDHLKLEKNNY